MGASDAMNDVVMTDHTDFSVAAPAAQQSHIPSRLRDLPHMQEAYDAYIATCDDGTTPRFVRMQATKTFAIELLQYYYPASEGFVLQESILGPMAKHGMNFMLKDERGISPHYCALEPAPSWTYKDPKKGKKNKTKPPTGAKLAAVLKQHADRETCRQSDHHMDFIIQVKWHQIEPEDIACLEVLIKHTTTIDGAKMTYHLTHTCLAIILAPPNLLPQLAETNNVQRGDILTEVFCRSQQIRHGHGMFLFGNWLELYDFDKGAET